MAWDKKPLPGMPLSKEVIGMKLNLIASGIEGTVGSHSQWLEHDRSPPLLEHITVIPCTHSFHRINIERAYIASSEERNSTQIMTDRTYIFGGASSWDALEGYRQL